MSARIARDPSPFRSGLVHSALGAFTLTFVLGTAATGIHLTGDPDAASPAMRVALFDDAPSDAPQLNPRLPGYQAAVGFSQAEVNTRTPTNAGAEPDLGVDYPRVQTVAAKPADQVTASGIRINGKTVMPGQTYSQVTQIIEIGDADTSNATVQAIEVASSVPENSPLARNAKPFANPEGKATISIIVGGLGINRTRTRAAINSLPPEVTLSFAPTADNLRGWVREARRAGHEVLIELPMEPYDYGRQRPHANVMQVSVSPEKNKERLSRLLAQTPGYFGVMNYQGAKFATDANAVDPIVSELRNKGVAFFEDGSLVRSEFSRSARDNGLAFGKATAWVDSRPDGNEISQQLMLLESAALERGAALGTAMPFPVTFDLLQEWLPTLEDKGILLAPASHYAKQSLRAGQVRQASLDPQG